MDRKNLYAFTQIVSPYPGFVSVNGEDASVEFTVRSPASPAGDCGACAGMKLDLAQARELGRKLLEHAGPGVDTTPDCSYRA